MDGSSISLPKAEPIPLWFPGLFTMLLFHRVFNSEYGQGGEPVILMAGHSVIFCAGEYDADPGT
jgi:hypothetical protein